MKKTEIYELKSLTKEDYSHIKQALLNGAVAVLPTDTVYGVTVCAKSAGALDKLNTTKNNPPTKPTQVLCTAKMAEELCEADKKFKAAAQKFWPGALTIVAKSSQSGAAILKGCPTIGLRVPDSKFVLNLMDELESPLLASSANMHSSPVCATPKQVIEVFNGIADIIVLGGDISTKPSAVIDLTCGFKVIRSGELDSAEIEKLVSEYK